MTKLVAAICLYEEEKNIEDCLESLAKIADLDAVDILDGAWSHGGKHMQSQDQTEKLVDDLRLSKRMPYEIYFTRREIPNLWKNESAKRNWQLLDIEHRFGEDTWILVIDADEEIESQFDSIFLKEYLQKEHGNRCGIISAHSIDSKYMLPTLRIIPAGHGIHYHSNKAMCVHDLDHNVIMDYEHGVTYETLVYSIQTSKLVLLNKGIKRTPERLQAKTEYFAHRMKTEGGRCRFERL